MSLCIAPIRMMSTSVFSKAIRSGVSATDNVGQDRRSRHLMTTRHLRRRHHRYKHSLPLFHSIGSIFDVQGTTVAVAVAAAYLCVCVPFALRTRALPIRDKQAHVIVMSSIPTTQIAAALT